MQQLAMTFSSGLYVMKMKETNFKLKINGFVVCVLSYDDA